MSVSSRVSLGLWIGLLVALASSPAAQVEVRLGGTAALLGEGDTSGLVAGLYAETPIVETPATAPIHTQVRVFGGMSGLRSGSDFYATDEFAQFGDLGYGRRTLLMAEAGLAVQAGWVRLAAGPSLRYRDESFVQSARLDQEVGLYEATVIESARVDVGGLVELGARLPVSETFAMGVHVSLRGYDAGTQMAGAGLSAFVGL